MADVNQKVVYRMENETILSHFVLEANWTLIGSTFQTIPFFYCTNSPKSLLSECTPLLYRYDPIEQARHCWQCILVAQVQTLPNLQCSFVIFRNVCVPLCA